MLGILIMHLCLFVFVYLFVLYVHQLPNQLHELSFVRPQQLPARARCGGENHRNVVYLRRHLNTDTAKNTTLILSKSKAE